MNAGELFLIGLVVGVTAILVRLLYRAGIGRDVPDERHVKRRDWE